jgi:hypothetical protein
VLQDLISGGGLQSKFDAFCELTYCDTIPDREAAKRFRNYAEEKEEWEFQWFHYGYFMTRLVLVVFCWVRVNDKRYKDIYIVS